MKNNLEDLKVGEYVWSPSMGWGKVLAINAGTAWPIRVRFPVNIHYEVKTFSFSTGGFADSAHNQPTLFREPTHIDSPKPQQFKQDQRVLVSLDGENWIKGYFAYSNCQYFQIYLNGDSWSSDNKIANQLYPYCKEA